MTSLLFLIQKFHSDACNIKIYVCKNEMNECIWAIQTKDYDTLT